MVIKSSRLKKDEDNRGWALQGIQYSKYFEKKAIKDIVVQTINIGEIRGEHYHRKKPNGSWLWTVRQIFFGVNLMEKSQKR